jgi:uncharacterized membrane protein
MRFEHEINIAAPAVRVWELTIDIERWPAITSTVTKVERLDQGPLRVGSRARLKQPGQGARVWTVTALEAASGFVWEAKFAGLQMVGSHFVVPDGDSCRNRLVLEITGRGAGLFGRVAGGRLRKSLATENAGFKKAAESG